MTGDERKGTRKHRELRRLASKIRSMEHLEDLVRQVPEGPRREAVRSLMLEHVKFKPTDSPVPAVYTAC